MHIPFFPRHPLKYLSNDVQSDGDATYATLSRLAETIGKDNADEEEYAHASRDMAVLFASPHSSVSSFELLQSGLVDNLLQFASSKDGKGVFQFNFFSSSN